MSASDIETLYNVLIKTGSFGVLVALLWYLFTKLMPEQTKEAGAQREMYERNFISQREGFNQALISFTQALQAQRSDFILELSKSRHGYANELNAQQMRIQELLGIVKNFSESVYQQQKAYEEGKIEPPRLENKQ